MIDVAFTRDPPTDLTMSANTVVVVTTRTAPGPGVTPDLDAAWLDVPPLPPHPTKTRMAVRAMPPRRNVLMFMRLRLNWGGSRDPTRSASACRERVSISRLLLLAGGCHRMAFAGRRRWRALLGRGSSGDFVRCGQSRPFVGGEMPSAPPCRQRRDAGRCEPGRNGRRRRDREQDPDAADERPDDLDRDDLLVDREAERLDLDGKDHEERQGRAEVGEDERVDGGGEVGDPDVHRPTVELSSGHRGADRSELVDRRRLADRDVVQDPEPAEDDGGQEEPAQVDPALGELLQERD